MGSAVNAWPRVTAALRRVLCLVGRHGKPSWMAVPGNYIWMEQAEWCHRCGHVFRATADFRMPTMYADDPRVRFKGRWA